MLVLALAILACLGAFFSEISGFGFTLKSRIGDVERGLAEAKEGVQLALSTTAPEVRVALDVPEAIAVLAARYNEIRSTMSSGHVRTAAMTALVEEMTEAFRHIEDFTADVHLRSEDRGLRLASVVYLCQHPDPAAAERLAELAMSEDKPFNAYWTLMALRASGGTLSEATRARLKRFGESLGYSDRAGLITQVLRPGSRSSSRG